MITYAVYELMRKWEAEGRNEETLGRERTYEALAEELGRHALTMEVMGLDDERNTRAVTEALELLDEIGIVVARIAIRLCRSQGQYTRVKTEKRRAAKC